MAGIAERRSMERSRSRRAAVLGADERILSTASPIVGVAAAATGRDAIVPAGAAGPARCRWRRGNRSRSVRRPTARGATSRASAAGLARGLSAAATGARCAPGPRPRAAADRPGAADTGSRGCGGRPGTSGWTASPRSTRCPAMRRRDSRRSGRGRSLSAMGWRARRWRWRAQRVPDPPAGRFLSPPRAGHAKGPPQRAAPRSCTRRRLRYSRFPNSCSRNMNMLMKSR
jgi:hypothetical protein